MSTLRKLFQKEVPKEWEARLAQISDPNTNRFSWLKLIWEPGHPWETPVDRYFVYEMIPEHAVDEYVLEQLRDYPPPSEMGNYYDTVKGVFVNNPDCLITERAWHLYKQTRCWGRPYWVIQGPSGGHKRWFSNVEKNFLKLAGLPQDPPIPGELPYAEFDEKVVAQLMQRDLMQKVQGSLRRKKSLLGDLQDERVAAEEKLFREKLVKWLADQVTEVSEGVMESLMVLDAPRLDFDVKDMERASEQATENFIQTGKSYGGMKLITP